MPTLPCAVSELPEHVFRRIIEQLSHRILAQFGYTDVIGDNIYINTDWSTHSETSTIEKNAILSQQAFRVDANIQLNPTSQKWDFYTFHHTTAYGLGQRLLNNTFPVYMDKKNRVRIIEMRSPVTIVMNCSLTFKSVELAYQTPQQIFNSYENGAVIHFNDLAFDYPVPKPIVSVLYGLWKMDRVNGKPAGVGFVSYLRAHSDNKWNFHRHREKDEYEVVVPVFDLKSLATLEYADDRPQGEMEDRLAVGFTIPFIYTVQFAMPTQLILQFPPVFNNQLVPYQYIPRDRQQRFNAMPERHMGYADDAYDKAYSGSYTRCVMCPWYDEWVVPNTSKAFNFNHEPVVVMDLIVEEDTPNYHTVIDLKPDFDPSFKLTDVVKEILYQQGEESVKFDTIYSVALYKEDKLLLGGIDYTFNEDLEVSFNAADLHAHYRLAINAAQRLDKINPKWYGLLKKYFPFLNSALKEQIAHLINTGSGYTKGNGNHCDCGYHGPHGHNPVTNTGQWWDPSWPPHVQIDNWGNIINTDTGKIIGNISDLAYPKFKGDANAYSADTRVVTNLIVARKTGDTTTGSTR